MHSALVDMEIIVGVLIGVVIGMTGIGGGTLTTPLMILLLGASPALGVRTALVLSSCIKANAVLIYLCRRQVDFAILGYLLPGGIPGAVIGALWLEKLHLNRWNGIAVTIIGVVTLICAACTALRPGTILPKGRWVAVLPLFAFVIGIVVGFSSMGAGVLGVLLLIGVTELTPAMVVGTDLAFGLVIAIVGAAVHVSAGIWDWSMIVKMLAGSLPGVWLGSFLANKVPAGSLRYSVLVWVTVLGFWMVYTGVRS